MRKKKRRPIWMCGWMFFRDNRSIHRGIMLCLDFVYLCDIWTRHTDHHRGWKRSNRKCFGEKYRCTQRKRGRSALRKQTGRKIRSALPAARSICKDKRARAVREQRGYTYFPVYALHANKIETTEVVYSEEPKEIKAVAKCTFEDVKNKKASLDDFAGTLTNE